MEQVSRNGTNYINFILSLNLGVKNEEIGHTFIKYSTQYARKEYFMKKVKNTLPRDFYISLPSIVLEDTRLTSTDKLVYGLINSFSLNDKGYCYLRYRYLAHYTNIKKRNLYNIIKKLVCLKYIEKIIINKDICLKPYRDLSEEMKNKNRQKIPVDLFDYNWLEEED